MNRDESAAAGQKRPEPRGTLRDPYFLAGCAIFLSTVVTCWTGFVLGHESLYLLGSRRVADPEFLATDFTWSSLPPTSFLFDRLLAPLWWFFGQFAVVNIGRFVWWAFASWSLVALVKVLRVPPWSAVAGFGVWMLWGQTFALCGSPYEGLQVKSFAYPFVFLALACAIRGRMLRAGVCAGVGAAFHILVGGWGALAILASLLSNRRSFSFRQVGVFLLAMAPFVLPLVLAVMLFHDSGADSHERARMDEIYVTFAAPKCCEVEYFMNVERWARAGIVFLLAPILVLAWPERKSAKIAGVFLVALVLFFFVGVAANRAEAHGILTLFPGQLGKSLPALFFFIFFFAWSGSARPKQVWWKAVAIAAVVGAAWLVLNRDLPLRLVRVPGAFVAELRKLPGGEPPTEEPLYQWIRTNTPADGVFITPFLPEFWSFAERAQVASIRHPPYDRRLIEWKERLVALNRQQPYTARGFEIATELDFSESNLSAEELVWIRDHYGATHYVTTLERDDLSRHLLHSVLEYFVYDIRDL